MHACMMHAALAAASDTVIRGAMHPPHPIPYLHNPTCTMHTASLITTPAHCNLLCCRRYNDFKPYVHYVPLSYDGSDLLQKIEWARQHDAEAQQIARNARAYAEANLVDSTIACYVNRLLLAYAKLQRFSPRVTGDMAMFRVKYQYSKFEFLKENSDFKCQYFSNR
jgi:hypothetical protein